MSGRADEDTRRWTLHIISSQGWISATVRSGWGREKKGKRGGRGEGIMPCILTTEATGFFFFFPLSSSIHRLPTL